MEPLTVVLLLIVVDELDRKEHTNDRTAVGSG